MNPTISADAFNLFFAWAPWVIGLVIYGVFFFAKRNERSSVVASSPAETFACAQCGRRGARVAMVAQDHGGAVSYVCASCATAQVATH